jgi:hypothetical protein
MVIWTLILVFLGTMLLGFPVAFCLGITSLVVLLIGDVPLLLIAQRMFTGIDSFPLMAVPFFVLAGELMNRGGGAPPGGSSILPMFWWGGFPADLPTPISWPPCFSGGFPDLPWPMPPPWAPSWYRA